MTPREIIEWLQQTYNYHTEEWKIPSHRSHNALVRRVADFLEDYESNTNLLLVYYGGHGHLNGDRQLIWSWSVNLLNFNQGKRSMLQSWVHNKTMFALDELLDQTNLARLISNPCTVVDNVLTRLNSTEYEESPTVQWLGIQNMLEQAASDVLILLDCCAAASATAESGIGVTEVIAACGFDTSAPGVCEHSFTSSLIEELQYQSNRPPFSAATLHMKVLSRMKYWKPKAGVSENLERRRTPVHTVLTNGGRPRSIVLNPLELEDPISPSHSTILTTSSSTIYPGYDTEMEDNDTSNTIVPSQDSTSQADAVATRGPWVLVSVALEEDQDLHTGEWVEWLRDVPAIAKYAHVEGLYRSNSTLILLIVPVDVWDLLPSNLAVKFIDFVESRNLLECSHSQDSTESKLRPARCLASNSTMYQKRETGDRAPVDSGARMDKSNSIRDVFKTIKKRAPDLAAVMKAAHYSHTLRTGRSIWGHGLLGEAHTVGDYKYSPLPEDKRTIRVVVLLPASDISADIQCRLYIASLDTCPSYDALSYACGNHEFTVGINLEGRYFQVTENLASALRHLRRTRLPRVLWIDALCVNPHDVYERNHQVQLMQSTYTQARKVLVWLGKETNYSTIAIKFLGQMKDKGILLDETADPNDLLKKGSNPAIEHFWSFVLEPDFRTSWEALRKLFLRPGWKRLHILQAAAVGREIILQCGCYEYDLGLFTKTASYCSVLLKGSHIDGLVNGLHHVPRTVDQSIGIWLAAVSNFT